MNFSNHGNMDRTARLAGVLYLIVVLTGMFSLAYVPSQVDVAGGASSAVHNLRSSAPLFRLGIAAGFVCYTAFLLLPLVLYRLLAPINRTAGVLMVALAVVSVPISLVNLFHKLDVLTLLGSAEYLKAFSAEQLHAHVMQALNAYDNGMIVSKIFWGLWLFPFGYLVFHSGSIPKLFGILLMLGCFGYLIAAFGATLFPAYTDSTLARFITLPAAFGEIGTCLWLLVMGGGKRAGRKLSNDAASNQSSKGINP